MDVSETRMAEHASDEAGQSRAPASRKATAEELLAELVQLVESSARAPALAQSSEQMVSEPGPADAATLQRTVDRPPSEKVEAAAEPPQFDVSNDLLSNRGNLATRRRSGSYVFKILALVVAGAAVIGSTFWLKRDAAELPKAPPVLAAAQSPTVVPPQSDLTVAAPSNAAAAPAGDVMQQAEAKDARSEERPIDPDPGASVNDPIRSADLAQTRSADLAPTRSADLAPTLPGEAHPAAVASDKPPAASEDTPAAAAPTAALMAPQSLDSKPAPAVSLPTGSPQVATPTPLARDSGRALASNPPLPPVRPGPKATTEAAGDAQRSTPKRESSTKLSNRSGHVVVAKADATAPGAPGQALPLEAPIKPDKGETALAAAQTPAEAQTAPPEQPAPSQKPNSNPVVRTFNNMVGAVTGFIPFMPH